jgi:hypothetical protein
MAKAKLKTAETDSPVDAFLAKLTKPDVKADCEALIAIMSRLTKCPPAMWGASIIGFGKQELRYETGRTLDWFVMGFSPRATSLVLYTNCDLTKASATLKMLGPHKTGKGCLYIKRLADVDVKVLERLLMTDDR